MTKKKNLGFAITEIKEFSSYLNSTKSLGLSDFEISKVGFSQMFQLDFNEESGELEIKITVDFKYKLSNNESQELFGIISSVKFHFIDWEGIIKVVDDLIDMPDDLAISLFSIAYSSTRGLLAAKTANTDYSYLILPLINPKEFKKFFVNKPKEDKKK